jgi:hypothetical protein
VTSVQKYLFIHSLWSVFTKNRPSIIQCFAQMYIVASTVFTCNIMQKCFERKSTLQCKMVVKEAYINPSVKMNHLCSEWHDQCGFPAYLWNHRSKIHFIWWDSSHIFWQSQAAGRYERVGRSFVNNMHTYKEREWGEFEC